MKKINVTDLAKAAKARLFGLESSVVTNVVIDSRECKEGSMFVCVIGENTDGHKYVEAAYEKGARVFLVSRAKILEELLKAHDDVSIIFAADTEEAFKDMAKWYIDLLGPKKIAVTGSVGKTTTKALIACVLSKKYKTVCSEKNYNTHLGMCMTCFLADPDTEAIVFEMGMDRSGEIDSYCSWIRPDTAVITVIGDSHLEKLGTKEAIADAKLEITHYFNGKNCLIYNCDSPFLDRNTLTKKTKLNFIAIPVGEGEEAGVQLLNIEDKGVNGISFDIKVKNSITSISLPLLGKHNAINAALAATCGMLYEVPDELIALALGGASGTDRRLTLENINGILLLDDSYNANPASMKAALEVLAGIKAGRHIAVLGDMNELGSDEDSGHRMIGDCVAELGIDILICIGKKAAIIAEEALYKSNELCSRVDAKAKPLSIVRFPDVKTALGRITELVGKTDAVLVKGSNATGVSEIAEMIRKK